ncbi:coiled-coil domain-containing protein 130 [Xenopus laevis]|uniref:Probable splicing factor YJU2B n=1 Tax=Xenopus laevis TaxID=8355 RepID=YJU2B_XENLA|nr:probable splicing factor YJU2B [Xenopus laevis]Q6DJK9.1 RecName: Full=Probable splicing factor YJU2B; AltName: Full=Coiled-coil domain-containing protein 130 [Xenopus laevis]AAH75167.1 MGC82071 protein [Xenopus laevis]
MGERKGTNKYYPPDFDPAKHGSLNGYRNSHPLRERARKLSQGILIIRFEMPYNIWCDGCKNHIGMGVRYNAEKKKVGNYYTTPIYRFRMKCHLCVNYIEMQTDPASCDYVIVSGAQRKEERWDMQDNEQILTTEHEQKQRLETDSMFRLEHGVQDKAKLQRAAPSLSELQEVQSAWKDDFAINSLLRSKFREEKKQIKEEEERDQALLTKASLDLKLVPEVEEDKKIAALLKYRSLESYEQKQKKKRSEICNRSWFSPGVDSGQQAPGNTMRKLGIRTKTPSVPGISPVSLGVVRRTSKEENKAEDKSVESPDGSRSRKAEGMCRKEETGCKEEITERTQSECKLNTELTLTTSTLAAQGQTPTIHTVSCLVPNYSDSSCESEG